MKLFKAIQAVLLAPLVVLALLWMRRDTPHRWWILTQGNGTK